jgi:hypothetical protein
MAETPEKYNESEFIDIMMLIHEEFSITTRAKN